MLTCLQIGMSYSLISRLLMIMMTKYFYTNIAKKAETKKRKRRCRRREGKRKRQSHIIIIIIIIIINQGTNARRCPMPFSLFDAIFVYPKQRGIVLVLMHHTSLLYCPSILYVAALFC